MHLWRTESELDALVVLVNVCYLLNVYSATVKLINLFSVNIFPILHFQTFFPKLLKQLLKF